MTLKCAAMRQDAFAFFRGTNRLFLNFLPRGHALFRAPCTLVCGDLHLENFGAFKGDNRLCYFDLNDFDEACLAPFTVDLVRFVASIALGAQVLGLNRTAAAKLACRFLDAYSASIADGKPRWMERSLAQGVFRTLLRRAMRRTRMELLNRLTRLKGSARRIRLGKRALPMESPERLKLRRFLAGLSRPGAGARFFKLLDAARRVAGNGSLGLTRYVLLVRGRGSPHQNFALDLKLAAPSAPAGWLNIPQPAWPSEAARVVAVQRVMQAVAPALLRAVRFEEQPFVLKELQPAVDRLAISQWANKPKRLAQAVQGMGHVTAWAHLRSCGHYGATAPEALQEYVASARWRASVEKLAKLAAARTERAWRHFASDYDRGAVTAALNSGAFKAR